MDYKKAYLAIIDQANKKLRCKGGLEYYENHHIKPRCLGGSNTSENLVLLTAKEHFIAHHLLFKMHPSNNRLKMAFINMAYRMSPIDARSYRITSSVYESVRKLHSKMMTGKEITPETRLKISASLTGIKRSEESIKKYKSASIGKKIPEHGLKKAWDKTRSSPRSDDVKNKISKSLSGREFTRSHRENLSKALTGKPSLLKGFKHSDESRKNMSNGSKGIPKSDSHKKALSEANKGKKWFTNGVTRICAKECPNGFIPGMKIYAQESRIATADGV